MWLQVIYFRVLLVLVMSSCSLLHEPKENRLALPWLPGVKSIEELSPLKIEIKKPKEPNQIKKNPKPHTKAKDFEYALRSVQDPTDEPWRIFLLWCIVLLIPAFDFLTSPSPQQGWQKSTCPHLSCSSPGPGILSHSLCSWNWDATLWTETKLFT